MSENHSEESSLSKSTIQDIRLAAKKMQGAKRRSFQAEMTEKYCGGLASKAASIFTWNQKSVELGLHEKRVGIICLGAQKLNSGRKKWEEKHPEVAEILCAIAEEHSQQDPTFQSSTAYTRLTAKGAIRLLRDRGIPEEKLPRKSAMAVILNRLCYRLRKVVKAKPQRKIPETDAIFENVKITSDFIVDGLENYWEQLAKEEQDQITILQIRVDNGPESSGVRTQFLKRMVEFADKIGKHIQLLYYPPYHSKYNPIERSWGILEKHWNGTKLTDVDTMLNWAQSMTWKGIRPIVKLNRKIYEKGVSLSKKAMRAIEARLKRNPLLPKWDIQIQPESCA